MKIEWNKVTWYSKLLAVAIFVLTFWIAFCFGIQYERINSSIVDAKNEYGLLVNKSMAIGDFGINLDSVSDSRCPSDVQCIWQGEAKATITFKEEGKKETKEFVLGGEPYVVFSKYKVSVLEITPYPKSDKQIKQSDYVVKIKVQSAI